jgi:WD40 repeat protein
MMFWDSEGKNVGCEDLEAHYVLSQDQKTLSTRDTSDKSSFFDFSTQSWLYALEDSDMSTIGFLSDSEKFLARKYSTLYLHYLDQRMPEKKISDDQKWMSCSKILPIINSHCFLAFISDRIELWDTERARMIGHLENQCPKQTPIWDSSLSLYVQAEGEDLGVYNFTSQTYDQFSHSNQKAVTKILIDPQEKTILFGSIEGSIGLWNIDSGSLERCFAAHSAEVSDLAYSPDGRYLISVSQDKYLKVWDSSSWNCITSFIGDYRLTRVAVLSSRNYVVGDDAGRIHFLRLERGKAGSWNYEETSSRTSKIERTKDLTAKLRQ